MIVEAVVILIIWGGDPYYPDEPPLPLEMVLCEENAEACGNYELVPNVQIEGGARFWAVPLGNAELGRGKQ